MNSKNDDLRNLLRSEIPKILGEYGVSTQKDLIVLEKKIDTRMDLRLKKLERSLSIKITKSKNDLAERIANVAVAKEERSKVDRIEKRVTTLENFAYA